MTLKGTILIVDDEEAILKILAIKLRISGYEVITASDGKKGLELARSKRPDLMLLDMILPRVSGFQVLEKLHDRKNLPIIAFSAQLDNAPKTLNLGADEFVAKPFDVDALIKRIDKLLNSKK